jgi:hypothetical protein
MMQSISWFLGLSMIGWSLASAGCSGDPKRHPTDDEEETTSASSSGAGGSGSTGSGEGGQGGQGGGQGGQGGESGSGDLLPLAVGYQWAYAIEKLGVTDECGTDNETTVLKTTTLDGKNGFDVDYFCSMPLALRSEGDLVEYNQGNGWTTLLKPPVEEGSVWTCFGSITCTWKSAGTVVTPAGTFSNCWTAVADFMDGGVREKTYCRGVGQVKSFSQSVDGNGYDAKLVSKSF